MAGYLPAAAAERAAQYAALGLSGPEALYRDDLPAFFEAIIASGRSSFMYLQNVYARPDDQSLSLALCLAEERLQGKGAWRIHGGGFAGTIQAFVPHGLLGQYQSVLEGVFGQGACYVLNIRNYGGIQVQEHL